MNKTRRMAIMKQRQKKKKYELRRKEAIRAGGGVTEIRRPRPARPKTVGLPLQEAVVAATRGAVVGVTSSPPEGKTTRRGTAKEQSVSTKPTRRAVPKAKLVAGVKGNAADKKKPRIVAEEAKTPSIKRQTATKTKTETKVEAPVPAKAKPRSVAKKEPEPKAKKAIAKTQASTVKPKTSTKVAAKKTPAPKT